MWIIELRFSAADDSHTADRLAARPAHRARLVEHHAAGRLLAAGPFADESGAQLIFDVAERAELDRPVGADPYDGLPGVEVTSIREWHPVVGP